MNEHVPAAGSAETQAESAALKLAAIKGLALRRASGEIVRYRLDGWMVQEHPAGGSNG